MKSKPEVGPPSKKQKKQLLTDEKGNKPLDDTKTLHLISTAVSIAEHSC